MFENKVVDFVAELATQTDKTMTRDELAKHHPGRGDDVPEEHHHDQGGRMLIDEGRLRAAFLFVRRVIRVRAMHEVSSPPPKCPAPTGLPRRRVPSLTLMENAGRAVTR